MARIAGIKEHKTNTGKVTSITINLKRWGQYLEDFLDIIEVERVRGKDDFLDWDSEKAKLLKSKK